MKIETQNSADLTQLGELIQNMPVAMLTMIEPDGNLSSRPMSPLQMDEHGAIWFFTDRRDTKVEHLLVVDLSFVDASHATYVSVSGHAEINMDYGRIEELWTPFARPWFPEGMDSPNLALLKFMPDTAAYWDAPHSKMVRMFAIAASVVAGKPIGLGEHDVLTGLSSPVRKSASR